MANHAIATNVYVSFLEKKGFLSWFLTTDHKRIGILYLVSVSFFFLIAGIIALLMRFELLTPVSDFMSPHTYNVLFTLHGSLMVFFFIIPGLAASFGNFLIPLMIGARDVAFPKLNIGSYWIYLLGTVIVLIALLKPADTGWTFYTPYSATTDADVILITFGVFVLGFSSILTGMNFIVTIHKMRAPGMTWHRLPDTTASCDPCCWYNAPSPYCREKSWGGFLRSRKGRGSCIVPELFLVLFSSGGLYYDSPRNGRYFRNNSCFF